MTTIVRMAKRVKKQQALMFLGAVIFIAGQVWFSLKIPDYMETITRLVKTPDSEISEIYRNGGMMLACAGAGIVSAMIASWFSVHVAASFSRDLRTDIYDKVESFSMNEIDSFSTASLITRSTNDVTQIQNFMCRGLQHLIKAPFMVVWALIKISGRHWQWTVLTVCSIAVMTCIVLFMMLYAHPKLRKRQAYTDDLSRDLRENLTGIRVIRAYNAEPYQEAKFDQANRILTDNERKAHHAMGLMRPTIKFVNNALMVGIYLVGAYLIASSDPGDQIAIFSDMVVYSSYAAILIQAFMDLNMAFNQYPRAAVSAERILQVLDTKTDVTDGTDSEPLQGKGTLEFQHVFFRYPGARSDVLHDISFKVESGKTCAIIGSTGSGKSTLINLIPRLYDPQAGKILIDGVDIRELSLKHLKDTIGYASQKAVLLRGTVASNVAYGDNDQLPRTDADITEALATAQALPFVERMDHGIDSEISRGGTSVSGGQRQRLSIARSICWHPQIYLFDDTFSALDFETDRRLRMALSQNHHDVTTLLVAQRIGTIRDADNILVLDQGRIVGQGTHSQLMHTCKIYQEIARTQLSEQELA
ncbi:MAG: ABC transporter ATP-binding protein/permease [Solobacterium sp.]|nr:ABC transporter ATP-binding protein/permease [Solobacterium sp.]MCH4265351.1 ABC transporter ATP-binding protein/permease [Solobacterium sp.]